MELNHLVNSFLDVTENYKLYKSYLDAPTELMKTEIESRFQKHIRTYQLISYFSKTLKFEAIYFDKKLNQYESTNVLTLDKPLNNESSLLDILQSEHQHIETFENPLGPDSLEEIISDHKLYKIIKGLKYRQKEILYYYFVCDMNEFEIAQKLNVTKQAVNKSKNGTLNQIRQLYSKGEWYYATYECWIPRGDHFKVKS